MRSDASSAVCRADVASQRCGNRRRNPGAGWSPRRRGGCPASPRRSSWVGWRRLAHPAHREVTRGALGSQPVGVVEGLRLLAGGQAHRGPGTPGLLGPDGHGPGRVAADDVGHGHPGAHRARQRRDRARGGRHEAGRHRQVDDLHDRRRRAHRRHRDRVPADPRLAPSRQHLDRRHPPSLPGAQGGDRGPRGRVERRPDRSKLPRHHTPPGTGGGRSADTQPPY